LTLTLSLSLSSLISIGTISETYSNSIELFKHPAILIAIEKRMGSGMSAQFFIEHYLGRQHIGFTMYGVIMSPNGVLYMIASTLLGVAFAFGPVMAEILLNPRR